MAVASILALRQGADADDVVPSDVYGDAFDFQVVYADSDLARDGCPTLSPTTIGSLSPGYHLLQWVSSATRVAQLDAYAACSQGDAGPQACAAIPPDSDFAEAPNGFATPVTLTLESAPVAFEPAFLVPIDPSAGCLPSPLPGSPYSGDAPCHILVELPGAAGLHGSGARPGRPVRHASHRPISSGAERGGRGLDPDGL